MICCHVTITIIFSKTMTQNIPHQEKGTSAFPNPNCSRLQEPCIKISTYGPDFKVTQTPALQYSWEHLDTRDHTDADRPASLYAKQHKNCSILILVIGAGHKFGSWKITQSTHGQIYTHHIGQINTCLHHIYNNKKRKKGWPHSDCAQRPSPPQSGSSCWPVPVSWPGSGSAPATLGTTWPGAERVLLTWHVSLALLGGFPVKCQHKHRITVYSNSIIYSKLRSTQFCCCVLHKDSKNCPVLN